MRLSMFDAKLLLRSQLSLKFQRIRYEVILNFLKVVVISCGSKLFLTFQAVQSNSFF